MKWITAIIVFSLGSMFLWGCGASSNNLSASRSQPPKTVAPATGALPPQIIEFQHQIRGKLPKEVAALIIKLFGPPNRNTGSGLTILVWDISNGTLELTAEGGPPKFTCADGTEYWLIDTENPIAENIIHDFEMATLPDQKNYGTTYYLGEVQLFADGTYMAHEDSCAPNSQEIVAHNFFFNHPHGVYSVKYLNGVTEKKFLENIPTKTPFAIITFSAIPASTANDMEARVSLYLNSNRSDHGLYFSSTVHNPLNYELKSGWHNNWGNNPGFDWDYEFPKPKEQPK